jgi:UDP-N-acetylmuramate dehydrogenase
VTDVRLSTLTTLGVGGPATLVDADTRDAVVAAVRAADQAAAPLLLLGGGSNLWWTTTGSPARW